MSSSRHTSSAGDVGASLPDLGVGIIYSAALEPLLQQHPDVVDLLEIEPQTTWVERLDRPGTYVVRSDVDDHLAALPYKKLVHSVGTPVGGSMPASEAQLPLLRDAVTRLGAPWASEHLAFNLTPDFFTGFFLPPRQTAEGLAVYERAILRLKDCLGVPIAFETGVNYLQPRADEIPDGEFVRELSERTGAGILLDLHNIYTNQCNGRQRAETFLAQIPLDRVWEVHLAGGFEHDGYWLDAHSGSIPEPLLALARDVVPHLTNVRALVFEVFTSFLPSFGFDGVRHEMDKLRDLWSRRRTAKATRSSTLPSSVHRDPQGTVPEWEAALGSLAIGRDPSTALARDLNQDRGVALMRDLIHEFRASMVVGVYRLSCRYMMLVLTPDVFRAILEDFWAHEPPRQFAAAEAEAFAQYLRVKNLRLPHLAKLLEFEKAAMDAILDGTPHVVEFAIDPFPLLRALADGRLPDGVPQVGSYEIELSPDGPNDVAAVTAELTPFH
jgi:uncharacterized protein (UPF0276 family)